MKSQLFEVRHGKIVVNYVKPLIQHNDIVLFEFDLETKYCDILYLGSYNDIPIIGISSPEEDIFPETEIHFTGFPGWTVVSYYLGRYTGYVTLVKFSKEFEK